MAKTAAVIDFPATNRARNKIRRSAQRSLQAEAYKAGFIHPSDQERELIELLRWTSFAGRDAVLAMAREMRRRQPWRDGAEGAAK